jgi:SAM-dependent methyltransferase
MGDDAGVYAKNAPQGFIDDIVSKVRGKIYRKLGAAIDLESLESILDVGVTSDRERRSANFFERFYPHSDRITAISDQDAFWMEKEYAGLKFMRGDGRTLPFPNDSFDLVFSSAVLEHVGNEKAQVDFVAENLRVARKYVYLTTPNRFHPMEFHTTLPLIHWLPKRFYHAVLRLIGKDFYADENILNLLSRRDLAKICTAAIAREGRRRKEEGGRRKEEG